MIGRLKRLARGSPTAHRARQYIKARLHLLDMSDVRQLTPLQLNDLVQACDLWSECPEDILGFAGYTIDPRYISECHDASSAVDRRAEGMSLSYPKWFDVAPRTEQLLFHLVRASQPDVVVETGIGNGRSSAIILAAMDLNGIGVLHSVDIGDDVGALVPDRHPRWVTHIGDGSPAALEGIIQRVGAVDIFIHDSDHRYRAQRAEYEIAERYGSSNFLLASDDVNWSNGFLDHCTTRGLSSAVLSDVNKCFGLAWRDRDRPRHD